MDRISDVAFDGNTCKTSASGSVNSTGLEPELLTRFELSSSGSKGDVIILNLNFLRLQNSAVKIFLFTLPKSCFLLSRAIDKQNGTAKKYEWTLYAVQRSLALKLFLAYFNRWVQYFWNNFFSLVLSQPFSWSSLQFVFDSLNLSTKRFLCFQPFKIKDPL